MYKPGPGKEVQTEHDCSQGNVSAPLDMNALQEAGLTVYLIMRTTKQKRHGLAPLALHTHSRHQHLAAALGDLHTQPLSQAKEHAYSGQNNDNLLAAHCLWPGTESKQQMQRGGNWNPTLQRRCGNQSARNFPQSLCQTCMHDDSPPICIYSVKAQQ